MGVKFLIHFYCVLHATRGEGVQIACKFAYVINGRPLLQTSGLGPPSIGVLHKQKSNFGQKIYKGGMCWVTLNLVPIHLITYLSTVRSKMHFAYNE